MKRILFFFLITFLPLLASSSIVIKLEIKGTIRDDLFPGNLDLIFVLDKVAGNAGPVTLDDRVVKFELSCSGDGVSYELERCEFSEALHGKVEGYAYERPVNRIRVVIGPCHK